MGEENKNESSVDDSTDNAGGNGGANGKDKDVVSYESHRKLLSEKKKLQETHMAVLEKLKAFEDAEKLKEKESLEAKGEYQKLIQLKEDEIKKLKSEAEENTRLEHRRRKFASVHKALNGKVNHELLERLSDYDSVVINPDTGEVDEMSVTKVVEGFKTKWGNLIKTQATSQLPTDAPKGGEANGGLNKIRYSDWLKLPPKEMSKYFGKEKELIVD